VLGQLGRVLMLAILGKLGTLGILERFEILGIPVRLDFFRVPVTARLLEPLELPGILRFLGFFSVRPRD
jgi:hypothetical protein